MAKKAKYLIRPSKTMLEIQPILPFIEGLGDAPIHSLLDNNQFLNEWKQPGTLEESDFSNTDGCITSISGNLLASFPANLQPVEISHIDNIPVIFLEEKSGSGIAHIHKSQSNGELIVYCLETDLHQAGDFIYTIGVQRSDQELENMDLEIFTYTLLDKNQKKITLQLIIQLSDQDLDIGLRDLGIIEEENLMTGTLTKTRGPLSNQPSPHHNTSNIFKFLPIDRQYSLNSMHLTAHKMPLIYELDEQGSKLLGKQAQTKQTIFSTKLDPKGLYDFELFQPIDRPTQTNLMSGNFKRTKSSLYQDIPTKSGKIYEFSFYFKPTKDILSTQALVQGKTLSVELWWAGLLICVIQLLSETLKGYHFTLEGQEEHSRLELKLSDSVQDNNEHILTPQHISEHLDMATLVPEEQTQIRFELGFENQLGAINLFPITLNLDHEVVVSQAAPYIITMDDLSPYKKIVLSDNVIFEESPATTLNLEKIFSHMQIPESHRHVEIDQLEHSNIYEIKISDKTDQYAIPITVADVELKFDGGNEGLETLFRYLIIDI